MSQYRQRYCRFCGEPTERNANLVFRHYCNAECRAKYKRMLCLNSNKFTFLGNYYLVQLSNGSTTKVSPIDLQRVLLYRWHQQVNTGYVYSSVMKSGKAYPFTLHRFILDPPGHLQVDHIDGDKLNNTRQNLRVCTRQQNSYNAGKKNSTNRFIGVRATPSGNFRAYMCSKRDGVLFSKTFSDEVEAAKYRDMQALAKRGEYARLNFPEMLDEYRKILNNQLLGE